MSVSDFEASNKFYVNLLGFKIEYDRGEGKEHKFAFLSYEGSQLMLDEGNNNVNSSWYTGKLEYPRGRGIHLQIEVQDINHLVEVLNKNNYPIKEMPKEHWYRQEDKMLGMLCLLVMDPDGYLIMFHKSLGSKKVK